MRFYVCIVTYIYINIERRGEDRERERKRFHLKVFLHFAGIDGLALSVNTGSDHVRSLVNVG